MSKDFKRPHHWKYKKLSKKWRRPRGHTNTVRQKCRGKPPMPSVGYRTPKASRHLHPSGLIEVRVHNTSQLKSLNPKYIVRIGSTVGRRKRKVIFKKARELGLRVVQTERAKREAEKSQKKSEKSEKSKKRKSTKSKTKPPKSKKSTKSKQKSKKKSEKLKKSVKQKPKSTKSKSKSKQTKGKKQSKSKKPKQKSKVSK